METPAQSVPSSSRSRHVPLPIALFLLVVAVVLVAALSAFQGFWQQRVRSQHYQAVFLTNGQVYFGKITRMTREEIVLESVYYLQASENPQQDAGAENTSTESAPATQFSIVKLGGEVHQPLDRMYITRSQVLFMEDLQDASQVVQTIESTR